MFWSFYSTKGGVGTSVIAAAVALERSRSANVLLVDFAGDQPDLLGVDALATNGVCDWLGADGGVGGTALAKLTIPLSSQLHLLPAGEIAMPLSVAPERCAQLIESLRSQADVVVADLGTTQGGAFSTKTMLAASGDRSSLVIRACYLALKGASRSSILPDDVIEVVEGGRALRTIDIEAVIGREVCSRVAIDPGIARAVDAGLMGARMPRALRRMTHDLTDDPAEVAA